MPKIEVNDVDIAFEIAGTGPPLVWTAGGRGGREPYSFTLFGRLSAYYRTLIWDNRNGGASGFAIDDTPSEWHAFTDDLHELVNELNMTPAYICGISGGVIVSILMAYRYPNDVKALILQWPASDDFELWRNLVEGWYFSLADAATKGGMNEVLRYSADPDKEEGLRYSKWISELATSNPRYRDQILTTDPKYFSFVLSR